MTPGGDWLSVAATGGNGGDGAANKSPTKRRKSSVAPGGWMSVKLGLSAEDEDDQGKPGEIGQIFGFVRNTRRCDYQTYSMAGPSPQARVTDRGVENSGTWPLRLMSTVNQTLFLFSFVPALFMCVALFAKKAPSTSTAGTKKQTTPSAASTASAGGGWLTSGRLGVSMGDDEEQPAETPAAPGSKTMKQRDKNGRGSKKKKEAPAATSAVPGGWLAAAVSTGTFGTPQDDNDHDQSDSDSASDLEKHKSPKKTSGSLVEKRPSSPGRGMPSWTPAKPASDDITAPCCDVEKNKIRGLGGGRPAWAPALPEPVAATAKEEAPAATEPAPKAQEELASEGGLPDWLAVAAGGDTKPKVSVAAGRHPTYKTREIKVNDIYSIEVHIVKARQTYPFSAVAVVVWFAVENRVSRCSGMSLAS